MPRKTRTYRYSVILKQDPDGGYVVTFPQFPEAITQGDTRAEASSEAIDCLDEAVAARMTLREALPRPNGCGCEQVELSPEMAAKAALYDALREARLTTTSAMARRLQLAETGLRRLLNPRGQARPGCLYAAMRRLGKRLRIEVVDLD